MGGHGEAPGVGSGQTSDAGVGGSVVVQENRALLIGALCI